LRNYLGVIAIALKNRQKVEFSGAEKVEKKADKA
jgi:hypothetical protein